MTYSLFFCAGIVVGLAASIPILAMFWQIAHKAAAIKVQSEFIAAQAEAMNKKKRVDQAIEKLRAGNPDMTREQEGIAREHLDNVFISRYSSAPTERQTPVTRD